MSGLLYIVSTPIGNKDDITFRALRILRESDIIICEEFKQGKQLLRDYSITKELLSLNEHNEPDNINHIIEELKSGKNISLTSDCGTPIFSDPGTQLIQAAISQNIKIIPIPGPDSLIPSLVASGFDVSDFYYAGWLSPKTEKRIVELEKLKLVERTIGIMETPYRLKSLLRDAASVFGEGVTACVAANITMGSEKFFRGTLNELLKYFENENQKFEFVLIINNKKPKRSTGLNTN